LSSRRAWLVYSALAALVVLAYWSVKFYEGTLPANARFIHLVLPMFAIAGLPVLAAFNAVARRSLAAARPLLRNDSTPFAALEHRLTTMPVQLAVAGAGAGLTFLVLFQVLQPADANQRLHIMVSPMATVFEWGLQFVTWVNIGVVGTEIARKLWVIDEIYKRDVQIRLFERRALTAFSRLSALMVSVTAVSVSVATIALAEFATTAAGLLLAGIPSVLALTAFVAPLWGGHRLIATEKARNVDALGERIESAIDELRGRFDRGELNEAGPLTSVLDGLIAGRNEYRSISTWPWQIATLGGVVAAVVSPLAIWLVTRAFEAWVG
jgi:hypothetical protein